MFRIDCLPRPAPNEKGIMDRLSSVPGPFGVGVALFLACALALAVISGCNAGVHADSHPTNSTSQAPAPVVATTTNPDGSITTTTTTTVCTKDAKGNCSCTRTVKIETVPAKPATSSIPAAPTGYKIEKPATRGLLPPDIVRSEPNAIPAVAPPAEADVTLEGVAVVEPDFSLAIAESDPPGERRMKLSQGDAFVQATLDATDKSRAQMIRTAQDAVHTLEDLTLPPAKAGSAYTVKAKVDGAILLEATVFFRPGEKPEDARERLKRFIVNSSGIFDEAYKREKKEHPTTSALLKPCVDSKGRPTTALNKEVARASSV